MKQLVFTHVPAAGFAAFDAELSTGEWACVDSSRFDAGVGAKDAAGGPKSRMLHQGAPRLAKSLDDGPTLVIVKLRLKWAVAALLQAIEVAGDAKECDRHWDGLQKQLTSILGARAVSNDPVKRAAAQRLQAVLLLRSGADQTKLPYPHEVDFGRKQVLHASQGQGAADVASLGLVPLMLEIASATEALATAIDYGTNVKTPQERKASARTACAATFASAAYWLGWIAEYGSEGDRDRAAALLVPLEELAARYAGPPVTLRSPAEVAVVA